MNKKRILYLIGIIILIILITKFAINVYSNNIYEKSRITDTENLAGEYNLEDAVVSFEYMGKKQGMREYNLTVDSLDFEQLSNSDKIKFINKLNAFDLKAIVNVQILSSDNIYERNYLYSNVLEKNGEEFYVDNTKQNAEPSATIYDKEPSEKDKSYSWVIAKKEVKDILKTPSTAKFPRTYIDADIKEVGFNTFVVKSYVDAENSFSAMIRTDFMIKIERISENSYNVLDIQIYE